MPLIAWTAIPNHEAIAEGRMSPYMLIFIMVVTWTHDSLAYATGRLFGKHKLALKSVRVKRGKVVQAGF